MHRHGPAGLQGPLSRCRPCWTDLRPEPEPRRDLIERVRREIAAGTYDTEERWQIALERLFECLGARA
jgi:hypothetical protein